MKKLLGLVLAAFSVFALAGCGTTPVEEQPKDKGYEVLNDFEDYGECIEPLVLLNSFGKVSENTDKKYVYEGDKSLKIVPEGCIEEGVYSPILKQPFAIKKSGTDVRDISQFKMLTVQVYNTAAEQVNMNLELQFFGGYRTNPQSFKLNTGWNTVIYSVDPQIVGISYDVSDCKALLFVFDAPQKDKAAPVLYLDEIRIFRTTDKYVPLDTSVSENEICSFDKLYQEYVLVPNVTYPAFSPILEINQDLAYSVKGRSLKVTMPKNDGSFTTYAYTGFSLNKEFIHTVGLGNYDENKYFSFWVYNAGSSQQRLFIEFFDYSGVRYYKRTDIYAPAGQWTQVKYKLSEVSGGTSAMTTGNAGEIYINWEINSLAENRVLYFDEFAIVD